MILALLLAAFASAAPVEVSATSGPVKLTLAVYKTRLKVGENVRARLTVTNVGKKAFALDDFLFNPKQDPHAGLHRNTASKSGTFLEALDQDGKPMPQVFHMDTVGWEECEPGKAPVRSAFTWDEKASNVVKLEPGESASNSPWAWAPDCLPEGKAAPKPIAPYMEVDAYPLDRPGRYRLRAVYDQAVTGEDVQALKAGGFKPPRLGPEDVVVRTPYIDIHVES